MNAVGVPTSKTVDDDETHRYLLDGSTILSEEWTDGGDQHLMVYVYDANGSPIGYRYRNSDYDEGDFDSYGDNTAAIVHTHPSYSRGSTISEWFSPADISYGEKYGIPVYMFDKNKQLAVYNPEDGTFNSIQWGE